MSRDRSIREERKAARRTMRRRRQAQAIADAEAGDPNSDGLEGLPTSFWKFAASLTITIAWIVYAAIAGWGTATWVVGVILVGVPFGTISWLKGRKIMGLVGLIVWPLAIISAIRLARPFSWWFDRFYVPVSRDAAEHVFSRGAIASARRSLTRQIGLLGPTEIGNVNDLYAEGHAGEYLRSEWALGRGAKEDPLPGHYRGLFQFFNLIDEDLPDSADPEVLGEYWALMGVDPWAEASNQRPAENSEVSKSTDL